ncbi:unnamed protein product [Rhizophagus irregularis]|nr:unnamed protein product [Rhizophagus irregularis]
MKFIFFFWKVFHLLLFKDNKYRIENCQIFESQDCQKRIKPFIRHQSDRYKSVKEAWRKPKGIDNRVDVDLRSISNAKNWLWFKQENSPFNA